jgi:hypothetical protein
MRLLYIVKELFIGFIQGLRAAWWAKITTLTPCCTYYFGPFQTSVEARAAYPGYVDDLKSEGAQEIVVVIKRCDPTVLTICDEAVT